MESMMAMEAENAMNPMRSFSSMELNYLGGGGGGGGYYPPLGLYSSRSFLPRQPPLLPLPFSVVATTVRSKNSMKRRRKKKARTPPGCIRQSKEVQVKKAEEEETGEEFLLSPSPSSLPLPRLLLSARPKAEAVSDDLRRLLCL